MFTKEELNQKLEDISGEIIKIDDRILELQEKKKRLNAEYDRRDFQMYCIIDKELEELEKAEEEEEEEET